MAQGKSDGTVYIDTKIDTSGIGKGIETVKNKIGSVTNSVKKFGDYFKKSFTEAPTGNAGRTYEEVARDIKKAEAQLDKLIEKQIRFVEIGGNRKSQTFAGMEYDIEMARNRLFELQEELSKTSKKAPKSMNILKKGVDNTTKSIKKMGNTAKKSNFSLLKMLGTSLLFSMVFRAISTVTQGFVDGLNNLVQYSNEANVTMSSLKSSLTQLKNSFATAFMPIINFVAPALNKLISMIVQVNNLIAQFFSALSGKSTYTKAVAVQEDYAESLDKTADSAKKAQKYLSGLDEIRTFTSADNDKTGEISPKDMFEEVELDSNVINFIEKIKDGINSLIPKVKELAEIFKSGFMDGLGDFQPRLDSIKESIDSIKESLIDIFTDTAVKESANGYLESFVYMLGQITGAIASIGLTIGANLLGGFSKYLEENTERIKQYLISIFDIGTDINVVIGDLFSSIAYIFEAYASEEGQQITADFIGIFSEMFMGITELGGKIARDVIELFAKPIIDSKDQIKEALIDLMAGFSEITEFIKTKVADIMDFFNQVYDEFFAPIFDNLTQRMTELVIDHLVPMLSELGEFFRAVGEALMAIWEEQFKPFIQWIIDNILPVILPIINGIVNAVMGAVGSIADLISGLLQILTGLIDFLVGVFTGDWEKAWEGIKDVFKGIINSITSVLEGFINAAIELINGLIGGVNSITSSIGIPSIPSIPNFNIPKLATGAVIPPNAPFLAMLGDQKHGTNIEAPLDTIKQAVREVVGNGNNGTIHAHLYLDGKEVLTSIIDMAKLEQTSTGINPLLLT